VSGGGGWPAAPRGPGTAGDGFAQALAFTRAMEDASCTRAERFAWGTALFHERVPRAWSQNFLRVDRPAAGATAELLAAAADRLQGGAGLAHRSVQVDSDADGARLAPGFRALGWQVERLLLMACQRPADHPAAVDLVEELDWAGVRPAVEREARLHHGDEEETVRQLVERDLVKAAATRLRWFAARAGGEVASFCELYGDGRTAQVESVTTFAEHRNRGLASAVVLRAVAEAVRAGHQLVFLVADDDDWPKGWYQRLGFDPIGRTWSFVRPR
jgi:N-acetylglutamate synthase-like GNAT family acetyltransferase